MRQPQKRIVDGRKRWVARWKDPKTRKEKSETFATKQEADDHLVLVGADIKRRRYRDPAEGRVRVDEMLGAWLQRSEPRLKPKTAETYASLIRSRISPALGHREIGDLRPSDVQEWVNAMLGDISPSRIRQAVVVLAKALDGAVADDAIAMNPARYVDLPRLVRHEAAFLEPETVQEVADAAPPPNDLIIKILGICGLRFGELAGLRRRDVDVLRRRLRVERSVAEVRSELVVGLPKSHQVRSVPMPSSLADALAAHLGRDGDPDDLVFTAPSGRGPLRLSNWRSRVWLPAMELAGVARVPIHALRHSAASLLISSGASPKAVATALGHASVAFSLSTYAHMFPTDLDQLADAVEERLRRGRHGDGRGPGEVVALTAGR